MAPVEGFFLPAASIKAQKIPKGIRRNETSLIPEYISRKKSMRHGNDEGISGVCIRPTQP